MQTDETVAWLQQTELILTGVIWKVKGNSIKSTILYALFTYNKNKYPPLVSNLYDLFYSMERKKGHFAWHADHFCTCSKNLIAFLCEKKTEI